MENKTTVIIEGGQILFDHILRFGATLPSINTYTLSGYEKLDYNKYDIHYKMAYGITNIKYKNNIIIFNYINNEDKPVGLSHTVGTFRKIILISVDKLTIDQFINEAIIYSDPPTKDMVITRILKNNYWCLLSRLPKRNMSTIYLDNDICHKICKIVNTFFREEKDYLKYGIPYKINILLYGLPGTGKTSLIFSIASKFNLDVNIIQFHPKITDIILTEAISNVGTNSILLLEDIDSLFVDRDTSKENKCNISFSGLLNALDGIGRKNKLIIFMTTNYIDKLDKALIRPGRIDHKFEFTYATVKQIELMFKKIVKKKNQHLLPTFLNKIKNYKLTTAMLQNYLFFNRKSDDIITNIKELYHLSDKDKYNSLYV